MLSYTRIAAAVLILLQPPYAFAHSALDRFWGEVPVDMLLTGDVLVTKTLIVPKDVTLTIEPGTTVRFEGSKDKENRIVIKGALVAAGTKDAPIRFVPKDEKSGAWFGLEFMPGSKGRIEHCIIKGATSGVKAAGKGVTLVDVEVVKP